VKYEISGRVEEAESGRGVPGVIVRAFDKDLLFDDFLGEVMSDAHGIFRVEYNETRFKDLFEKAPDIYLAVKTVSGIMLHTTKQATRFNASPRETFRLQIPGETLRSAGIRAVEPPPPISQETLGTLSCFQNLDMDDDMVKQIKGDMVGKSSILEMMKGYMADLHGGFDNDALPLRKLQRLFELGSVPKSMHGHHYGVTLGLRTGNLTGLIAEYGNLIGYLWGVAMGDVCPWVGKSFVPMAEGDRMQVMGATVPDNVSVYRGINHFNVIEHAPANIVLNSLLNFMWQLRQVTAAERLKYGHERNGGHFAAHCAFSIYEKTPRKVLRLNYRFPGLDNFPPLTYLIDEVVEIADGLYLGQLLLASARLWERYDPRVKHEDYCYQHFGYFLIFREEWNVEAKRLFPHLEMPEAAVPIGVSSQVFGYGETAPQISNKFTTLTLADPVSTNMDPEILNEVRKDVSNSETIIHTLKYYSDTLGDNPDTRSPVFDKLHALFNAGICPTSMGGFYRGALVTWQGQGLLAAFNVNTLNIAWQATRAFSPWTGKIFNPIEKDRLPELTDGHETIDVPTFFCSNTVVFRTAKEKLVQKVMELAKIWVEEASEGEKRLYGYHAKTFFFIARPAKSILIENKGREVLQLNYRWKALRSPPPDCFCVDEVVQIAHGLYIGQLIYATDVLRPWDPSTDPAAYKYRLFGYFLLMDEEWHARRLRIGFDLANT